MCAVGDHREQQPPHSDVLVAEVEGRSIDDDSEGPLGALGRTRSAGLLTPRLYLGVARGDDLVRVRVRVRVGVRVRVRGRGRGRVRVRVRGRGRDRVRVRRR